MERSIYVSGEASSGEELVRLAELKQPDLIVTDTGAFRAGMGWKPSAVSGRTRAHSRMCSSWPLSSAHRPHQKQQRWAWIISCSNPVTVRRW